MSCVRATGEQRRTLNTALAALSAHLSARGHARHSSHPVLGNFIAAARASSDVTRTSVCTHRGGLHMEAIPVLWHWQRLCLRPYHGFNCANQEAVRTASINSHNANSPALEHCHVHKTYKSGAHRAHACRSPTSCFRSRSCLLAQRRAGQAISTEATLVLG